MLTAREADYIADNRHKLYWIQSANGNWWTEEPGRVRLVVFERHGTGRFAYCINRPGKPAEFSQAIYRTEDEAKDAALNAVG